VFPSSEQKKCGVAYSVYAQMLLVFGGICVGSPCSLFTHIGGFPKAIIVIHIQRWRECFISGRFPNV
jgi:hypothetical protein